MGEGAGARGLGEGGGARAPAVERAGEGEAELGVSDLVDGVAVRGGEQLRRGAEGHEVEGEAREGGDGGVLGAAVLPPLGGEGGAEALVDVGGEREARPGAVRPDAGQEHAAEAPELPPAREVGVRENGEQRARERHEAVGEHGGDDGPREGRPSDPPRRARDQDERPDPPRRAGEGEEPRRDGARDRRLPVVGVPARDEECDGGGDVAERPLAFPSASGARGPARAGGRKVGVLGGFVVAHRDLRSAGTLRGGDCSAFSRAMDADARRAGLLRGAARARSPGESAGARPLGGQRC